MQLFVVLIHSQSCFSCQIPNPLFDLAGITCGHFLVPFWTFFGATLIGKALIKTHIQVNLEEISVGWVIQGVVREEE